MTGSARSTLRRLVLSVGLLLGRRAVLFVAADLLLILVFGTAMLFGGGDPWVLVMATYLLIGVPVLSDAVDLERRAGSLDLALSSPGADDYFERRVGSFLAVLTIQAWLLLVVGFLFVSGFPLAPALVQAALGALFLGAATLFFAVRLKSAGSVMFGTYVAVLAFSPWFFGSPVVNGVGRRSWIPLVLVTENLDFATRNAVLASATALLYLYARRRLSRPESLLS